MELVINCESRLDCARLVYDLVTIDDTFSYNPGTRQVFVKVESIEDAHNLVTEWIPTFGLAKQYKCLLLQEGKEPKELTA